MKKYIVLVCASVLLCVLMIGKIYSDDRLEKLQWRFDLVTYAFPTESYWSRFTVSYGSISIGTAYRYDLGESFAGDVMGSYDSWFLANDTSYSINIHKGTPHAYFPLLMRYTPYSRSLGFGDIGVYGYFHASLWNKEEMQHLSTFYEYTSYDELNDKYSTLAYAQFNPSFWFKIGIGASFNPLRFIPFDVSVGYLRTYYPYHRIPTPYREHVSRTSLSRFYLSLLFSLGYQSGDK